MALDLSKIKGRLESLKNTGTKTKHLWKPNKGKNTIRIIPYKHNPENPFIELLFHYGINNKTFLSPASFGRPDPIVELANKLKKTGDKEEWKEGRKIEPKMRTYVPILVRGQESEGVKFWGMGKTVYQEILGIISDPDYGDITDLSTGRDLVVDFKDTAETGKSFPETSVRAKPAVSKAFDPNNTAIRESIKNMIDFLTLYPELSYQELAREMDIWLNAPADGAEADGAAVPPDDDDVPTTTSPIAAAKAAARTTGGFASSPAAEEAPKSETVAAQKPAPATAQAVADEFDSIFNQN